MNKSPDLENRLFSPFLDLSDFDLSCPVIPHIGHLLQVKSMDAAAKFILTPPLHQNNNTDLHAMQKRFTDSSFIKQH